MITSAPGSGQHQEVWKIQSPPPLPFNIKEAWILIRVRWFFGTLVCHLLGLLDFWIKLLFPAPIPCLSIYWSVMHHAVLAWTSNRYITFPSVHWLIYSLSLPRRGVVCSSAKVTSRFQMMGPQVIVGSLWGILVRTKTGSGFPSYWTPQVELNVYSSELIVSHS